MLRIVPITCEGGEGRRGGERVSQSSAKAGRGGRREWWVRLTKAPIEPSNMPILEELCAGGVKEARVWRVKGAQ